eukprot:3581874-Pleurochrysis_carterae.AAC.1
MISRRAHRQGGKKGSTNSDISEQKTREVVRSPERSVAQQCDERVSTCARTAWNAGSTNEKDMGRSGRTRSRSRGTPQEEQRQPDFSNLMDTETPGAQGTVKPATGDTSSLASLGDTPPETREDGETQGETEGTRGA